MITEAVRAYAKEKQVSLRLHTMDGQWLLTARGALSSRTVVGYSGKTVFTENDLRTLVNEVSEHEACYTQGPIWDGSGFDF